MTKEAERGTTDLDAVRRDIDAYGVGIAYQAFKEICLDKTAPAPARATSGVAIFRAAGLLDANRKPRPDANLSELTGDELKALMSGWKAEAAQLKIDLAKQAVDEDPKHDDGGEPDIFE